VKNINDLRQSCIRENSGQRAAVGGRDAGLDAFCSSLQACFLVLKREQITGLISAPNRIRLSPMSTAPNQVIFTLTHSNSRSFIPSLFIRNNVISTGTLHVMYDRCINVINRLYSSKYISHFKN
jgi:hypothetical protein